MNLNRSTGDVCPLMDSAECCSVVRLNICEGKSVSSEPGRNELGNESSLGRSSRQRRQRSCGCQTGAP